MPEVLSGHHENSVDWELSNRNNAMQLRWSRTQIYSSSCKICLLKLFTNIWEFITLNYLNYSQIICEGKEELRLSNILFTKNLLRSMNNRTVLYDCVNLNRFEF